MGLNINLSDEVLASIIIVAISIFTACPKSTPSDQTDYSVSGKVTDRDSGMPIIGAELQLVNGNSRIIRSVESGQDGMYSLFYSGKCDRTDPNSRFTVRARKSGYSSGFSDVLKCTNEVQILDFQLGVLPTGSNEP